VSNSVPGVATKRPASLVSSTGGGDATRRGRQELTGTVTPMPAAGAACAAGRRGGLLCSRAFSNTTAAALVRLHHAQLARGWSDVAEVGVSAITELTPSRPPAITELTPGRDHGIDPPGPSPK
jgi:hypothetical protein